MLISKEILRKDLLGVYGGENSTPNIDRIASEATVFHNYYAGGGSTAMAVTTMLTSLNPYELRDRSSYEEVNKFEQAKTLFQELSDKGYDCHVVWPKHFDRYVEKYMRIFDQQVKVHSLLSVSKLIPTLKDWTVYIKLEQIDGKSNGAAIYLKEIGDILKSTENPIFIWAHLPHVLSPYEGYEQDIKEFDKLVGAIYSDFDVDLFVTADHGQMRGEKGLHGYISWLFEGVVNIPLITPRLAIGQTVDFPVGANQLMEIILDRQVVKREFVYSDSRYYKQSDRVFMIRSDNYKYLYNKETDTEELYDLDVDPAENMNLLKKYYDYPGRNLYYPYEELFYYKFWDRAKKYYIKLREEKDRIWRSGNCFDHFMRKLAKLKTKYSPSSLNRRRKIKADIRSRGLGRWGARVS